MPLGWGGIVGFCYWINGCFHQNHYIINSVKKNRPHCMQTSVITAKIKLLPSDK